MFKTRIQHLEVCAMRTALRYVEEEKEKLKEKYEKEKAEWEQERATLVSYTPVAIKNSRGTGSKTEFLVKWEDDSETWEPRSYVNAPDLYKEWRNKCKAASVKELRERKKTDHAKAMSKLCKGK